MRKTSNKKKNFSVSLICATKGRKDCILERIPIWSKAGFDEVIIVDGNIQESVRNEINSACIKHRAIYIGAPVTVKDIRSFQRNLGARSAKSEWIMFADDDDDIFAKINHKLIAESAEGKDWLVGPVGEHIILHRRESFLKFGGYPEDMVAAEDIIMSNRARLNGKGGLEKGIYIKVVSAKEQPKDYPLSRAKNSFWYGYTVFLLFLRIYNRQLVINGDIRRLGSILKKFFRGDVKSGFYFIISIFSRFCSIFYVIKVGLKSGRKSLERDPFGSWQGLR